MNQVKTDPAELEAQCANYVDALQQREAGRSKEDDLAVSAEIGGQKQAIIQSLPGLDYSQLYLSVKDLRKWTPKETNLLRSLSYQIWLEQPDPGIDQLRNCLEAGRKLIKDGMFVRAAEFLAQVESLARERQEMALTRNARHERLRSRRNHLLRKRSPDSLPHLLWWSTGFGANPILGLLICFLTVVAFSVVYLPQPNWLDWWPLTIDLHLGGSESLTPLEASWTSADNFLFELGGGEAKGAAANIIFGVESVIGRLMLGGLTIIVFNRFLPR